MKFRRIVSIWYHIAYACYYLYDTVLTKLGRTRWMERYFNFRFRIGVIDKHGGPRRCYKCAHDRFKDTVIDKIDYTVTEYRTDCERCGTENGYWSYGHWE